MKILIIFTICVCVYFLCINNTIEHFDLLKEQVDEFFDEKLNKNYKLYPKKLDTIFVSVASYRDDECPLTIKSLYDNAENPDKLFVGICSQNKPGIEEEECLPKNFKYTKNIRIKRLKHTDAKGPNFARYVCSHLWKGEEYFCQIDSHLIFKKNWDTIIKNMYKSLPEKSLFLHLQS